MVLIDAVVRLIPGVLGDSQSAVDESFGPDGGLEYPQYTRPRDFRGRIVPEILLSGDHAAIARWRLNTAGRGEANRSRGPIFDLGPIAQSFRFTYDLKLPKSQIRPTICRRAG